MRSRNIETDVVTLPGIGEVPIPRDETEPAPYLGAIDLHLLGEGTHPRIHERLGAHVRLVAGVPGVNFAVWAPNAAEVQVVGDFNGWSGSRHVLRPRGDSGVRELFVPGVRPGAVYKYRIRTPHGEVLEKADPYAFCAELPPRTASVVWEPEHFDWSDHEWMEARRRGDVRQGPMSIYEVHLASWARVPEEGGRELDYRELATRLVPYLKEMGYTHVELMPVAEHPFGGSWGYQVTGYFAPTRRFGTPDGLAWFVDHLHRHGIGVLLDWVPAHFPKDEHGLARFDGTCLYEHEDPRQGEHRDWGTLIFNYGRNEVKSFLVSNALFWLETYHLDGLRVDAVASMLYRDYSRQPGDWVPNVHGGRENLEAVAFLRQLNEVVHREAPGAVTIAEESTAWPGVSKPVVDGGLGFDLKWNMGWMHDTLSYMQRDPIHRRWHQGELTFSLCYAFDERFALVLSHDEVVHQKGSLIDKMPGDEWQRFANLRALYGYMYGHPGKKLLFMGADVAQWCEWNHEQSVDWHLLDQPLHRGVSAWVRDLNHLYRTVPALHRLDHEAEGFRWIDCEDRERSVVSFVRQAGDETPAVVVCNFSPTVQRGYRIGVPREGWYHEVLNSDAAGYGGSGVENAGARRAEPVACHDHPYSITLDVPPLAVVYLMPGASPEVAPVALPTRAAPARFVPGRSPESAWTRPEPTGALEVLGAEVEARAAAREEADPDPMRLL